MRVLAQHELDATADLHIRAVADDLEHERAPSSMSSTAIGSGATNGAGIVWLIT